MNKSITLIGHNKNFFSFFQKMEKIVDLFGWSLVKQADLAYRSVKVGIKNLDCIEVLTADNLQNLEHSYSLLAFDFGTKDNELIDKINEESLRNQKIIGVVDISKPYGLAIPIVRNFIRFSEVPANVKELTDLGQSLSSVVHQTVSELQKIKKFHEKIVPQKIENVKGLKVFSKYCVGESSGGEFFDFISTKNELVILVFHTNSYVASSTVLSYFSVLKESKQFEKEILKDFLEKLRLEISSLNVNSSKTITLEIMISMIDLSTMEMEGYQFGGGEILSDSNKFVSSNLYPLDLTFYGQAYFSLQMNRGEKYLLISPGVRKNSVDIMDGKKLENFLKEQFVRTPKDLLDEVFFHLKKKSQSEFLKYDATVIYIEVDKNVIFKV